jgi:hypothetical protein
LTGSTVVEAPLQPLSYKEVEGLGGDSGRDGAPHPPVESKRDDGGGFEISAVVVVVGMGAEGAPQPEESNKEDDP